MKFSAMCSDVFLQVSETIPVGNVARHPGGGGGPGARTTPHAFVRCYCKEMVSSVGTDCN